MRMLMAGSRETHSPPRGDISAWCRDCSPASPWARTARCQSRCSSHCEHESDALLLAWLHRLRYKNNFWYKQSSTMYLLMKCVNELLHDAKTSKTPIASVRELCWYFSLNVKCLPVRLDCPVSRVHPDGGVLLVVECPEVAAVPGQWEGEVWVSVRCRHSLVSAGAGPAGHHPPGGQHRSWTLQIQTTHHSHQLYLCTPCWGCCPSC